MGDDMFDDAMVLYGLLGFPGARSWSLGGWVGGLR
jgi:hypothetical protein